MCVKEKFYVCLNNRVVWVCVFVCVKIVACFKIKLNSSMCVCCVVVRACTRVFEFFPYKIKSFVMRGEHGMPR